METSVNNKCKAFTSLEQSKKLAEILPLESADMVWEYQKDRFVGEPDYLNNPQFGHVIDKRDIACWSLSALLEQLDDNIADDDGNDWQLEINKEDGQYYLNYHDRWRNEDDIETDYYDDLVDACYEMILKLNELNLL